MMSSTTASSAHPSAQPSGLHTGPASLPDLASISDFLRFIEGNAPAAAGPSHATTVVEPPPPSLPYNDLLSSLLVHTEGGLKTATNQEPPQIPDALITKPKPLPPFLQPNNLPQNSPRPAHPPSPLPPRLIEHRTANKVKKPTRTGPTRKWTRRSVRCFLNDNRRSLKMRLKAEITSWWCSKSDEATYSQYLRGLTQEPKQHHLETRKTASAKEWVCPKKQPKQGRLPGLGDAGGAQTANGKRKRAEASVDAQLLDGGRPLKRRRTERRAEFAEGFLGCRM